MPKFKITAPDGSRKFIVTSEDAETALHDLKNYLSTEHCEAKPVQVGVFARLYLELLQNYNATIMH